MKAALLKSYGNTDQFQIGDIATPQPGRGDILIKIEASAVNPFDLILRQGFMAAYIPLPLPAVLGSDAAGTVVAVGEDVNGFAVGDRVVADFAPNGKGANAEYGVVPSTAAAHLPDALSFDQGAALVKAGLTGQQVVDALSFKPGDKVLVSGALGSVGRVAIHYLRQAGAHPVAAVRPERLEEARALAGDAIDITLPPAKAEFTHAISAVAPVAGQLIAHVVDGGEIASIVPVPEGANVDNRVAIHELYHRTDAAMLTVALEDAAKQLLTVPVGPTFPLDQISAAHDAVAEGARGRVILLH